MWVSAPAVQVVGNANKHIARVAKFLTKYGELALFPVKLQASPTRMPEPPRSPCVAASTGLAPP